MSDITRVPMCRFCGQVNLSIDPEEYDTASAMEEAATRLCTCAQSKEYVVLCRAAERAKAEAYSLLVDDARQNGMTIIDDAKVLTMLDAACDYVAHTHYRVTIDVPRGKITVAPNGLQVKIQRTKKRSAESTAG